MPKRVARIDGVFSIEGRGTVIALPKDWELDLKEQIYRRERIQIRTRTGACISTFIQAIEAINRGPEHGGVALSLPPSIKREDVPEGSELWLERDGKEPVIEP